MKNSNRGFTLIELLIVVAIIAILTGMIITNIMSSRGKARDAKKISDIAQIQLGLEQYFDKNHYYPTSLSSLSPLYISVIPKNPKTNTNYDYKSDSTSDQGLDYILHVTLEYPNKAISDAISGNDPLGGYTCNSADIDYCIGPK